jgi:hypothetical protein
MPLGLTNARARFQDMMNHISTNLLNEYIEIYIDNILIYA